MAMQTEQLKITGMTCGGCITKITHALKAVSGVGDVTVSLSKGEATVQYDQHVASTDQIKSAVKGAGYGVDPTAGAPGPRVKGGCCG